MILKKSASKIVCFAFSQRTWCASLRLSHCKFLWNTSTNSNKLFVKIVNVIFCSLIGLKNYLTTKYLEVMPANTPPLERSQDVFITSKLKLKCIISFQSVAVLWSSSLFLYFVQCSPLYDSNVSTLPQKHEVFYKHFRYKLLTLRILKTCLNNSFVMEDLLWRMWLKSKMVKNMWIYISRCAWF